MEPTAEAAPAEPSSSEILRTWIHRECKASDMQVKRIPFAESRQWRWDKDGFISHYTKRFFRVVGVRYYDVPDAKFQTQPLIDQPEIGLLSFLVCRENQEWWILAQAKAEPGNVNVVQIAPTVQATKSNYEVAHGGGATPYLSQAQSSTHALCCQFQSEQNSRFLAKRNQNSVILMKEKIPAVDSRYRWIRLRQLLTMLREDHTINTDARSVLVCWLFTHPYALEECIGHHQSFLQLLLFSLKSTIAMHKQSELYGWLDALNSKWQSKTVAIPLQALGHPWECGHAAITSTNNPAMAIHHIEVRCATREVTHWDQPISASQTSTRIVLLIGLLKGTLHLLLQARLEAGNRSGFELTTTVQDDLHANDNVDMQYLRLAESGTTMLRFCNSEEGGRFDRCVSEYKIVRLDHVNESQEGVFYRWVSLSQFSEMLASQKFITNELRSAVSALLSL